MADSAFPQPPPGLNYIAAIEPSLTILLINVILSSFLVPTLIVILYTSTQATRRKPIFVMNIVSIVLAFALAAINTYNLVRMQQLYTPLHPIDTVAIEQNYTSEACGPEGRYRLCEHADSRAIFCGAHSCRPGRLCLPPTPDVLVRANPHVRSHRPTEDRANRQRHRLPCGMGPAEQGRVHPFGDESASLGPPERQDRVDFAVPRHAVGAASPHS